MATVVGGRIICDSCGRDCTKLYGLKFEVRAYRDAELRVEVDRIDRVYGKHDFVFCWECCVRKLGAKTLVEQAAIKVKEGVHEEPRADKVVPETIPTAGVEVLDKDNIAKTIERVDNGRQA